MEKDKLKYQTNYSTILKLNGEFENVEIEQRRIYQVEMQ